LTGLARALKLYYTYRKEVILIINKGVIVVLPINQVKTKRQLYVLAGQAT